MSEDLTSLDDLDVGQDIKLDFQSIIWHQINRNSLCLSRGFLEAFFEGVLNFESLLSPYIDELYEKEFLNLEKGYKLRLNNLRISQRNGQITFDTPESLKSEFGRKLQRELIKLMYRKKLMPVSRVEVKV